MKKSLIILVSAAAIFAACQSNDIKNDVKESYNDSAIGFSTFAGKQTRGAENSGQTATWALEGHSTTFDVWAWKYYNSQWVTPPVYYHCKVQYDPNATTTSTYFQWDADTLKYWDKSAEKYYFYAAAPASDNWILKNKNTTTKYGNEYYLTYKDFTLAGGIANNITPTSFAYAESFKDVTDVDLLIADDNEVLRAEYNKPTPDKVNELFDHILSRLNVTVALKPNGTLATQTPVPDVRVTSFKVYKLKNKGSFNENATLSDGELVGGTTKRWGTFGNNDSFTSNALTNTEAAYELQGADISGTALTTTAKYIAQYLIVPQLVNRELLDRAEAKTAAETYSAAEIAAAVDGDDAFGKNAGDVKQAGGDNASYPYLKIDYKINNEPYTAYYNLANAFGVVDNNRTIAFNEGWQNTLNIQIDADKIVFDAEVYEWKDKENKDVTIFD